MSFDYEFWNEPRLREDSVALAVYRGIPYLVDRQEYCLWEEIVAPGKTAPAGVLLTPRADDYNFCPVPEDYQTDAEEIITDLIDIEKIMRHAAELKDDSPDYHKVKAQCPALVDLNTEEGRGNIASNVIEEAFEEKNYKKLARLLEISGIDFIHEEMSFMSSDGYTIDTLYVNKSGGKITETDRDAYETLRELVTHWADNEVYTVMTPFAYQDGFCNLGAPDINDNSQLSAFIRKNIDQALTENKKARYRVSVPTAANCETIHGNCLFDDISFDPQKRIDLYVNNLEHALAIKKNYPENSVKIVEREKGEEREI